MTVVDAAVEAPDRARWLKIADEAADDLATDAVLRDQAGKTPYDEVARLREAGLLTLLIPAEHGGGGGDWPTACAVVRKIAAADGAIGQVLGCHYLLCFSARFFGGADLAARLERRSAAEQWCWGGGLTTREPRLTLTPGHGGHMLNGRQGYATGVLVADRLAVRAIHADTGEPLAVFVDATHPGVVCGSDDGDTFGQRLAAGGSVEFDAVPVGDDAVLGPLSWDEDTLSPFSGLSAPTGRLVSAQICLGIAQGVLAEAREYTRAVHAPWPHTSPRDPYALTTYGELTVATFSAAALADQALEALDAGLARGEDLTDDECAEITVLAAAAEAAASRAAHDATARALDVIGARSASSAYGFDRFWRNARTHTLYDPVAHRLHEVGDYFLNGEHPPFTLPF
ncbi:acyl-CoA dehydrogenase family protein [Streptomyces luomodiensis]|uniref:Acyl-CoA dehydrogenase family protein n=1 Tax=Streptomyces luomodiensis TaxID=3026192 RepID=A0ABY9V9Y4_9ACTN|nr:acyl-CoA dehydrogenase family protein [Streptomyces sp. SCA4-21]WNF00444.1 acyl-CoA dehydrogenase family protein [Streptomyces sp. SCA4-21]